MDFLTVEMSIPITVTLKVTNKNFYWLDTGINNNTIYLAVNHKEGVCQAYTTEIDSYGNKYISNSTGIYAFRETDNGIQFYTNSWRYFDKLTQELWAGYKAEEALLGDS